MSAQFGPLPSSAFDRMKRREAALDPGRDYEAPPRTPRQWMRVAGGVGRRRRAQGRTGDAVAADAKEAMKCGTEMGASESRVACAEGWRRSAHVSARPARVQCCARFSGSCARVPTARAPPAWSGDGFGLASFSGRTTRLSARRQGSGVQGSLASRLSRPAHGVERAVERVAWSLPTATAALQPAAHLPRSHERPGTPDRPLPPWRCPDCSDAQGCQDHR